MKTTKLALSLLTVLVACIPLSANDKKDETTKIVYQCDFPDEKRVDLMLNTLNNLVSHYQKNLTDYEIDIVALGPCLQYFMKDYQSTGFEKMPYTEATQTRLRSLVATSGNINLFACENTMKQKNVVSTQLLDIVKTTPAGVVKVIDDQKQGYSYIKIQ
jgi:hypothetical protein